MAMRAMRETSISRSKSGGGSTAPSQVKLAATLTLEHFREDFDQTPQARLEEFMFPRSNHDFECPPIERKA
jgi:hypothetical protein